jgi:hypothetical protein
MIDLNNIVYAPISLEISQDEIKKLEEEHNHPHVQSFYSRYRTCKMIPLRTSLGSCDPKVIADKNQPHDWTENLQFMPKTKSLIEEKFLPLVGDNSRIITLCTSPSSIVKAHYDCSEQSFAELQLKMRLVIKGQTDSLWFLGPKKEKVFAPKDNPLYLISGAHPHGAINNSSEEKMTICFGGHFTGDNERIKSLLKESFKQNRDLWITHDELPRHFLKGLFQENYEKSLLNSENDDRLGIDT